LCRLTHHRRFRLLDSIGYYHSLAVLLPQIVALSLGTAQVKCLERRLAVKIETPSCTFWLPKVSSNSIQRPPGSARGYEVRHIFERRPIALILFPSRTVPRALHTSPLLQYGMLKHQEALRHSSIWAPVVIHLESPGV